MSLAIGFNLEDGYITLRGLTKPGTPFTSLIPLKPRLFPKQRRSSRRGASSTKGQPSPPNHPQPVSGYKTGGIKPPGRRKRCTTTCSVALVPEGDPPGRKRDLHTGNNPTHKLPKRTIQSGFPSFRRSVPFRGLPFRSVRFRSVPKSMRFPPFRSVPFRTERNGTGTERERARSAGTEWPFRSVPGAPFRPVPFRSVPKSMRLPPFRSVPERNGTTERRSVLKREPCYLVTFV